MDVFSVLETMKRPKILMLAARHRVADYTRDKDLRKLTRTDYMPGPSEALLLLISLEKSMNHKRVEQDGTYNVYRHVDVLGAILGEAVHMKKRLH
ncbi:MAG: DUF6477 family protein [Halocynthiibacter sp.]